MAKAKTIATKNCGLLKLKLFCLFFFGIFISYQAIMATLLTLSFLLSTEY
jgi:hypothetical protein